MTEDRETHFLADANAVGKQPMTDHAAYERVTGAYRARIRAFFLKKKSNDFDADDLTQQTFARVIQGRGQFPSRSAFEGWLFTIARNVWRTDAGKQGKSPSVPLPELDDDLSSEPFRTLVEQSQAVPSPLDRLASEETRAQLRECVQALPPKCRQCTMYFYFQHRTQAEISDLMTISIGTVKAHLSAAREKLAECMTKATRAYASPERE